MESGSCSTSRRNRRSQDENDVDCALYNAISALSLQERVTPINVSSFPVRRTNYVGLSMQANVFNRSSCITFGDTTQNPSSCNVPSTSMTNYVGLSMQANVFNRSSCITFGNTTQNLSLCNVPSTGRTSYVGLRFQAKVSGRPSCVTFGDTAQNPFSHQVLITSGQSQVVTPLQDITNVTVSGSLNSSYGVRDGRVARGSRSRSNVSSRNTRGKSVGRNSSNVSDCVHVPLASRVRLVTGIGNDSSTGSTAFRVHGNPFLVLNNVANRRRVDKYSDDDGYEDLGDPDYKCSFCTTAFWFDERLTSPPSLLDGPQYSKCCSLGKVVLPMMKEPPMSYKKLLYGFDPLSREFLKDIRRYNNMFSFTSMGGVVDSSINDGRSPPNYRISGDNYHLIGSLLPTRLPTPCFAQLYIYDTENEVSNRLEAARVGSDEALLNADVVVRLKSVLDDNNALVSLFRHTAERVSESSHRRVRLRLVNRRSSDGRMQSTPQADEVVVLIVGDVEDVPGHRDIVVESRSRGLERIDELHVLYLPLQYPLIFVLGEDGFREDVLHVQTPWSRETKEKYVTLREYAAYRLHERALESPHLFFSLRLTQQLLVDLYTMVEQYRLKYIRGHQSDFRCDSYKVLDDALIRGDVDSSTIGKRIVLPPSFTGGARFMVQNYHDAMSICRWVGYPSLFITFTCNPKWDEIVRYVEGRNLTAKDRQDVITRIFHMKLARLLGHLKKRKRLGDMCAAVYTIEWQNRGLPHAHILIWLTGNPEVCAPESVDKYISAEIPDKDEDPRYYAAVEEFMMHGPCGASRPESPCMISTGCNKHFPKRYVDQTSVDNDGFVVYRRRNDGRSILKSGVELDNRYVVPHNRGLLLKFRAHINVEYCNRSRSIKYLFKYVHKGRDRVTAAFYEDANGRRCVDEIKQYLDCRYVSAAEASWRLFGFQTHYRQPSVVRLGFHLEHEHSVCWREGTDLDGVMTREKILDTMFTAWMSLNETDDFARTLSYAELPMHYVWKAEDKVWTTRSRRTAFGRLYYVYPGSGELFYLRILLNVVRGCRSFAEIREYDGVTYDTYREACYARGLLDDDKEYVDAIEEASHWASEHLLRSMFANLLLSDSMSSPGEVFEKSWEKLSADFERRYRRVSGREGVEITLTEFEKKNMCLHEIEKLLQKRNRSLRNWTDMPFPQNIGLLVRALENQLIADELAYDRDLLRREHDEYVRKLNDEQRSVYDTVISAVSEKKGGAFFLYGYGGTGKTFVWKTLSAAVRCKGGIVLNVASSGIASLLLPGGRTAHSRFAIPIQVFEGSVCNVKLKTPLADLLAKADLIIWDEAPMTNRHCFEALDRTLRDIMKGVDPGNRMRPFGGKVVVLGGDFRQILPVIPKGSRQDIVRATINSSPLWQHFKVLRLTKNMRLENLDSSVDRDALMEFSNWLSAVGDGTLGGDNDGEAEIEIPADLLITEADDFVVAIVRAAYPDFLSHVRDSEYLRGRAVLSPTLDEVNKVNAYMVGLHEGEERTYLSSDSICPTDRGNDAFQQMHTVEYLNTIRCSGLPNHELKLKEGIPVMLLRNIDHTAGLCNGTRLLVEKMGERVIHATMLGGENAGESVLIPRLKLSPSDSRIPFKFQRRQFPLMVSYAMTINKSQGQSLSNVAIYLPRKVFSHGQLYVGVSRATAREGLKVLIVDEDGKLTNKTTNVVYKEVFNRV